MKTVLRGRFNRRPTTRKEDQNGVKRGVVIKIRENYFVQPADHLKDEKGGIIHLTRRAEASSKTAGSFTGEEKLGRKKGA